MGTLYPKVIKIQPTYSVGFKEDGFVTYQKLNMSLEVLSKDGA